MAKPFDVFSNVKKFMQNDDDSFDFSGCEDDSEDLSQPETEGKAKAKKRKKRDESPELIPAKTSRTNQRSKIPTVVELGDNDTDSNNDENENEESEKSASSSDDEDIYENHVSKYTNPDVLNEVAATVAEVVSRRGSVTRGRRGTTRAAATRGKGRGRGRGRQQAAVPLSPFNSDTIPIEQAIRLALSYNPANDTSVGNPGRGRNKKRAGSTMVVNRMAAIRNVPMELVSNSPIMIHSGPSTPSPPPVPEVPAVRSNVIATVDMTGGVTPPGSPLFKKNKVIDLDDGSDSSTEMNYSYDPDVIRVKVKFKGEVQVHNLRKHQKFADLMKKISKKEKCKIENVFLDLNGSIIDRDDSPHSINYKISHFLSARIMDISSSNLKNPTTDTNIIEVKFQSDKWKKPLLLKISKVESFHAALEKLAEEIKMPKNKIKISFDGDAIELNSTPEDEGLEGGEIIDCKIL